ncbi:MAG: hypothetical protein EPN93_04495 [Spirochaetes bacterium]|nr:MAG: hypothetical protein EPN93_04495 [Spirochaetota bacterium]
MKSKKFAVMLLAAVFAFSGAAFAQEKAAEKVADVAPVKAEEPKALVDVSGLLYLDYAYFLGDQSKMSAGSDNSKTGEDTMRLNRIYLNFSKKFDDVWSAKVTLDGAGYDKYATYDKGTGDGVLTNNSKGSVVYVKNAYVEMKKSINPIDVKLTYGIQSTPVVGLADSMAGSRWIYNNYLEKSNDLLGTGGGTTKVAHSLDYASADMGIRADVTVMKMVTFTGMYANGDGFKYTEDQKLTDKAYTGIVSITPIKGLFVNGYYHNRDIVALSQGAKDDDEVTYKGAGVAWSDKLYKVGINYFMGNRDSKTPADKADYTLMDMWANINLQAVAGMPILLYARYATGETKYDLSTVKKADGSTYYAGIGYQFNKDIQVMLVYQSITTNDGTVKLTDDTLYAKMEVKF